MIQCNHNFNYFLKEKLIFISQEKATLEEKLEESFKSLEDSKSYINTLVEQTKAEKRNRARYENFLKKLIKFIYLTFKSF